MAETPRPASGGWKLGLLAGLVGILIGALATAAFSGFFVRRALMNEPEMIAEAIEALRERETATAERSASEAAVRHRAALETPFHGAWAGAAQPDVVLVEFFDYACGFCRTSNPHVDRLLAEDPRLRVVWREFPVLGPQSEQAAVASLAAARSGRYREFYDALFEAGPPSEASIAAASRAVGLGEATLDEEARRELARNYELARAIGAQGTPTFVVAGRVLQGAVGYDALRQAVAEARAERAG